MTTPRHILQTPEFRAALRGLGCPNAQWMVNQLAGLLFAMPELGSQVDDGRIRGLTTNVHAEFPALRLYYCFDDDALLLMDVEVYDPLLPEGEVAATA